MPQMIAIAVTPALSFTPEFAIRGELNGSTIKIQSVPPMLDPLPGDGDWLEQDAFGTWQRRPTPNGSDAKFGLTASGAYLIAAHRGNAPAILTPIQTWTE